MQNVDDEFYERADEFINLANEKINPAIGRGKVSASFMYGMARFCSYVSATNCDSKEEFISEKNGAIEYFQDQFRKVLEENYDDYIEHYEKYMGDSK